MLLIVWFTSRRQSCQRTSVSLLKVTKVTPILCVNTLSSVFLSNAETCYPVVLFFLISYAAIWVALHLKRIPSVTRFNKSSPTLHGSQSSSLNWTSTLALDELFFSWYLTSSFFSTKYLLLPPCSNNSCVLSATVCRLRHSQWWPRPQQRVIQTAGWAHQQRRWLQTPLTKEKVVQVKQHNNEPLWLCKWGMHLCNCLWHQSRQRNTSYHNEPVWPKNQSCSALENIHSKVINESKPVSKRCPVSKGPNLFEK